MLKKRKLLSASAIVAVALLRLACLGADTDRDAAAATSPTANIAQDNNLVIYDPSGTTQLGRAHYVVTQRGDMVTIEGRNDFNDGERDVEHDTLRSEGGDFPRMLTYEHDYFDARGAPQLTASADMVAGKSSCAKYENGKGTIETAVLEYPRDSYAGAGVLVPIANQLRRGATDLDIHVFDCAAGPRILTLHADLAREQWRFLPHEGELAKAEAHPVFGWFNVFLKPFVPKIRMWFDPLQDYAFVGGTLSRYYRGPEVLLVSARPKAPPAFELPKEPAFVAPHDSASPAPSPSASPLQQ
ncbi:MAG TPA: hypothetical protein VGI29_07860 [Candidatus Binataceae bacterium]